MEVKKPNVHPQMRKVELLISTVLRGGVVISLLFVVGGTILSFTHHPGYLRSPEVLSHLTHPDSAVLPRTPRDIIAGLRQWQGQSVIVLGLLILVATPVARVAISILAFVIQRDRMFTIITSIVLGLLILSFVLGKIEG
ncbi:MAG TPA: DUF1634 domain-containing protein [Tepidisphaeraceae bacterium]|jgi:uncharacterized membrane protein|nr:DUF1634 domain-containing protein [Tepidisphaeraceae bacterium]